MNREKLDRVQLFRRLFLTNDSSPMLNLSLSLFPSLNHNHFKVNTKNSRKKHDLSTPARSLLAKLIQSSRGGHLASIPETANKRREGTVNSNPRGRWLIYTGDTFPGACTEEEWKKEEKKKKRKRKREKEKPSLALRQRGENAKRLSESESLSLSLFLSRVPAQKNLAYPRLKRPRRRWSVERRKKGHGCRKKERERKREKERNGNLAVNHPAFAWSVVYAVGRRTDGLKRGRATKRNRDPACR